MQHLGRWATAQAVGQAWRSVPGRVAAVAARRLASRLIERLAAAAGVPAAVAAAASAAVAAGIVVEAAAAVATVATVATVAASATLPAMLSYPAACAPVPVLMPLRQR
jgi:hypothetical protein